MDEAPHGAGMIYHFYITLFYTNLLIPYMEGVYTFLYFIEKVCVLPALTLVFSPIREPPWPCFISFHVNIYVLYADKFPDTISG